MNVAEINPLTLPSLPLSERKQLPNCPAIYFVMQDEHILYIGKTINLTLRWATHNRLKQFAKMAGNIRVAWLECSDTTLLRKIEAALIEQFEPELNRRERKKRDFPSKRVHVTLPDRVFDSLQRWADDQGRPIANLVAYLVEKAVEEAETQGKIPDYEERQQQKKSSTSGSEEEK